MSNSKNTIVGKMSAKLDDNMIKVRTIPNSNRPPLKYVPIDKTILFLNRTFEDNWGVRISNEVWHNIPKKDSNSDEWINVPFVTITVELWILDDKGVEHIRPGVGSDVHKPGKYDSSVTYSTDPDKMVKSALANAIKKAANLFGFATELWDPQNIEEPKRKLRAENSKKAKDIAKECKLSLEELSDILSDYEPQSNGNPSFLADENEKQEDKNVDNFIAHVKKITTKD